jgi:hypothetical protein
LRARFGDAVLVRGLGFEPAEKIIGAQKPEVK